MCGKERRKAVLQSVIARHLLETRRHDGDDFEELVDAVRRYQTAHKSLGIFTEREIESVRSELLGEFRDVSDFDWQTVNVLEEIAYAYHDPGFEERDIVECLQKMEPTLLDMPVAASIPYGHDGVALYTGWGEFRIDDEGVGASAYDDPWTAVIERRMPLTMLTPQMSGISALLCEGQDVPGRPSAFRPISDEFYLFMAKAWLSVVRDRVLEERAKNPGNEGPDELPNVFLKEFDKAGNPEGYVPYMIRDAIDIDVPLVWMREARDGFRDEIRLGIGISRPDMDSDGIELLMYCEWLHDGDVKASRRHVVRGLSMADLSGPTGVALAFHEGLKREMADEGPRP